ncbi:YSC84-related protein [Crenobacter sp. SG2303]|uniref:YSC84-related protein n=1 Tax=Crenobacter oryzisoli TaxID=3056844 RepID=A0ABT7XMD5_9NEIS|nr:YSC84-related protein [Crenobacter sp. SG2303]MDN0074939.1 YSC84-related protein [Crenobacter sp. SG2303]
MQRRTFILTALALSATSLLGCTTTSHQGAASGTRREIDAGVDNALSRLYSNVGGSRELVGKARGVLVFPSVVAAGLMVGGEYGTGSLREGGRTTGYYSTTSGSFGLQIGAQSKTVMFLFMNQAALNKFKSSSGWTAGVDASVAVLKVGANGKVDTSTATQPIIGFVMTNAGLMADLTLEGTKVSKLDL